MNNIHANCKICGNGVTRWIKSTNKWWEWCSNKCMGADPEILAKKAATNLKLFGSTNHMDNELIKQRGRDTCLAKYGVDNAAKSEIIKQRGRDTCLAKYGVDNASKDVSIIADIRDKAIQRYTADKESIIRKRKDTCFKKFGVLTNKHVHIPAESITLMKDLNWLKYQHLTLKKPCDQIANELGVSATPILTFLVKNGIDIIRHQTSRVHIEIYDYIQSIYTGEIQCNTREIIAPKEIDIYLPELQIGIEVNGIFWHSEERGKDRSYHVNKTAGCEDKNIHLIQIYDSEWNNLITQNIVKSKLAHLLKKSSRIYARNCSIQEIDSKVEKLFLTTHHLQGPCSSRIKIGLFNNNELIAVASLGKSRYNKKYEWELLRYCAKCNHTVVGGLSKILKHVIKKYKITNLISYADRRWTMLSESNIYSSTGFNFLHLASPNYKYFNIQKDLKLLSRNQFQKHMLKNKLTVFDPTLSEHENMVVNGYYRIWDSGNLVYMLENK